MIFAAVILFSVLMLYVLKDFIRVNKYLKFYFFHDSLHSFKEAFVVL